MNINLTPDDLRKTDAVEPGWFPAEIQKYSEEVTKGKDDKPSDGSMNAIYEFKVLDGPPQNKGRVIKKYFNEKSMFFGKNLWITFGLIDAKAGGSLTPEKLRSLQGQKLEVYVKQNGQYPNIEDYRPLQKK